jgi:hypothetical protein
MVGPALPGAQPVEPRTGIVEIVEVVPRFRASLEISLEIRGSLATGRPQGPPDRHDGHDRDEDRQLRLDQRGDDREDRGPLGSVAPQLADPEQEEHDAERVDLAPQDGVEPADRVEDGERGTDERRPAAAAELADHRPDEPADRDVGQDRRDLDQVADPLRRSRDEADEP